MADDGVPLHHQAQALRDGRREREAATPSADAPVYRSAANLPPHLKRLHNAQMRAIQEQREAAADPEHFDDEGRYWPGLVQPDRPPNPQEGP